MHLIYLSPLMDEASNLLEDIIVPKQRISTGYCNLYLDLPLVHKVVDLVPSSVDPTLSLENEEQVVHTTLPLNIEFNMVNLMSSPPDPTLSSKSVNIIVVLSTQSSYSPSLPVESEMKTYEVFVVSSNCSRQGEILSISTEPSPSTEVISSDWSNLTKSHIPLSVPFNISIQVTTRSMLFTIADEGA